MGVQKLLILSFFNFLPFLYVTFSFWAIICWQLSKDIFLAALVACCDDLLKIRIQDKILVLQLTLDKTISSLEMQLAAARAAKGDTEEASPIVTKLGTENLKARRKVFFVMGIITAFSSRKRRDSIRETWMPKGDGLLKLENEKGIIMRFVIGHSATAGGVLDRAIDAEDEQHKDFLRLNHIEGYHELSSKTQIYFSTAVAKWDADFYIKVDDDVHVNLGMVGSTLARHRSKPRVYIGCMKSGPVLGQKGVKYHEPEYWKFGQIYAISKDLATYISVNRHILHRYANEDVSLGSWFIGLDVEHIDDRSLCCGTAPGMTVMPINAPYIHG
ncbi:Beta-1,6-galactosyltransferase GALT31A [Citrus sinensis]|uniref:Beta-1,6-galactosyltransferase GALT31A n=1 Tax=Citrus sinensis TaxID=2711 RepID=A0ACB8LNR0_CITSI|nr:Beta-1,6-galactosyltransferase GALT31A [Citrus sinensis]